MLLLPQRSVVKDDRSWRGGDDDDDVISSEKNEVWPVLMRLK